MSYVLRRDTPTVTQNTNGPLERAFNTTGGAVRQKERMLETCLEFRLIGTEEVDGVSQRVPGSGRAAPRNEGAAVE